MKYIVFSIDTHIQEFLFVFSYIKGEEKIILGELIKLNNLCYIKDFGFDFFEISEDPNILLLKEGIYIYEYNDFTDVINRLKVDLTFDEMEQLSKKNDEIYDLLTKNTKGEILSIIYQDSKNYEIFRKMFFK